MPLSVKPLKGYHKILFQISVGFLIVNRILFLG